MKKITLLKTLLMAVGLCMGVSAWADEVKTTVYSNDFETSSDWTANGKTDGWRVNPGNTTANTFGSKVIGNGSGTGDMGLLSPAFGIDPEEVSIVDVEMKFKIDACTSGKSSGIEFVQPSGVTIGSGYISAGTPFFAITASASGNGYFGSINVNGEDKTTALNITSGTYENNSLNRNTTGIVVLNARFNFTTKEATYTMKKTDGTTLIASTTVAFRDVTATTLDKIFIHAGKSFGGVTIDDVVVSSVETTTTYANYTVHFVDGDGATVKADEVRNGEVGSTVNANSTDKADYYSGNYKYVYANDGDGVEVLNDGSAELTVTYTKYAKYNYTVNAIDAGENILAELATGYIYTDANSATTRLPWYVLYNGTLYYQNQNSNTTSITSDGQVVNITYASNTPNVVYYSEGENISGGTWLDSNNGSNKAAARALSNVKITTLQPGKYQIYSRFIVSNGSTGDTYCTNPFTIGATALVYNVPAKANTNYTSEEFTVTESTDLYVNFAGSSISGVDYVYIKRTAVPATITSAGYATFSSAYDLDFTDPISGLTAYKATSATASSITLDEVDSKVKAGDGLVLKGSAGTYYVPVTTGASTIYTTPATITMWGNIGSTTQTVSKAGSGTNFVLSVQSEKVVFAPIDDDDATLNPGQAALWANVDVSTARALKIVFADDETTGISDASRLMDNREMKNDNFFNLNGQRVTKPSKGLYIVGGKKVILK